MGTTSSVQDILDRLESVGNVAAGVESVMQEFYTATQKQDETDSHLGRLGFFCTLSHLVTSMWGPQLVFRASGWNVPE